MNFIQAALSFPSLETLATEKYEARGIFHSEMALMLGVCRELKIDVIVESGRARGQSTYLLAKYLPDVEIFSVDRQRDGDTLFAEDRLMPYTHRVALHYGDGRAAVPDLVRINSGRRIAVLLDGPKGMDALDVLDIVKPHIKVGFIHDMRKLDHGGPSPFRAEAERRWPNQFASRWPTRFFTDQEDYVRATEYLDAQVLAAGEASLWKPYVIKGEYIGSYGPTLGAFLT